MKHESFSDYLQDFARTNNYTLLEIGKRIGLTLASISYYKSQKRFPKDNVLEKFFKAFNIKEEERSYITTLVELDKSPHLRRLIESGKGFEYLKKEVYTLPKYGKASAGRGHYNFDKEVEHLEVRKKDYAKDRIVLEVFGNSMETSNLLDSIPYGSNALIDLNINKDIFSLHEKVCVVKYNDEMYIKQILLDKEKEEITLHSFNPLYLDIVIKDIENLEIIGKVYKIENFKYW